MKNKHYTFRERKGEMEFKGRLDVVDYLSMEIGEDLRVGPVVHLLELLLLLEGVFEFVLLTDYAIDA